MILMGISIQGAERPMNFILDSGAGETVLAASAGKELEIRLTPGERVRTVHGVQNAWRAETTHMRFGTAQKRIHFSPRPLVMDLSKESRILGSKIDGLLGADFFARRSVRIDFGKSRIHVSPEWKPASHATSLPLTRSRGAMFIGLTAADSPLLRVRLDTGCCRSLCWTPPNESSFLRKGWRNGKTMKVDVNLGCLIMNDVPTDVYRQPLFAGEDGLLGTAFLSRFDSVWIDSVNHRIAFETAMD